MVQLLAPCGLASSVWKEELILFSDGTLLGDFSDNLAGANTRLSLIPDGTYEDTDDSGCIFQIKTTGKSRSLTWGTQSNWLAGGLTWTMPVGPNGAVVNH